VAGSGRGAETRGASENKGHEGQSPERPRMRAARAAKGAKRRADYEAQSLSATKPWLAEGMSRTAWYRAKQAVGTGVCTCGKSVQAGQVCAEDSTRDKSVRPSPAIRSIAIREPDAAVATAAFVPASGLTFEVEASRALAPGIRKIAPEDALLGREETFQVSRELDGFPSMPGASLEPENLPCAPSPLSTAADFDDDYIESTPPVTYTDDDIDAILGFEPRLERTIAS
jgi:hypothetical protein